MDFKFLAKSPLFQGCSPEEVEEMLSFLAHSVRKYSKNTVIYHVGAIVTNVGLVLKGSVQIENIDLLGNKNILGIAQQGDVFAESYACIPNQPLMVDVVAREAAEILFINVPELFHSKDEWSHSTRLISNLLLIASRKNLGLSMRIFHSSPKTIRGRLYSYFSEQVSRQNTMHIQIPLDRQQLADYLGVERTALSKELGKMKREGLIDFKKNDFMIYL
jgi:CRP-like cAMP-binding protein